MNNKQIVSGLDVSAASVSEMISKLVKEDLVEHSPYQGVQLTEKGLKSEYVNSQTPNLGSLFSRALKLHLE